MNVGRSALESTTPLVYWGLAKSCYVFTWRSGHSDCGSARKVLGSNAFGVKGVFILQNGQTGSGAFRVFCFEVK